MAEDGSVAIFPVVFTDGEREGNIGSVKIHPSMEFKNFQSGISHKIGISPNQFTVYLVDGKKPKLSTDVRRKIPVTGKVNFAAVTKETDCFFLVELKRSKRSTRSRPSKPNQGVCVGGVESPPSRESFHLLRRNQPDLSNHHQISALEYADFNERLQNLQIQRENYARMMNYDGNFELNSFPGVEEGFRVPSTKADKRPFCKECADAAPFHHCPFDAVTVGFRTTAGPIARPRKAATSDRLAS